MAEREHDRYLRDERRLVERLLQAGLAMALLLLAAGLVVGVVRHEHVGDGLRLRDVPGALPLSARIEGLGVVVLGITPLLRVVLLAVLWARQRDWRFAGVALLVMAMLLAALLGGVG